ncbi:hypothetical protein HBB16_07695 [Pseudonocardia sp. MCCB 268]|nr:hypothetical protein [Pseudonocardia cytotoxica]
MTAARRRVGLHRVPPALATGSWSARTVSQCGDVFATRVALALLVFDLTGSALGVVRWCSPRSCRSCCFAPRQNPGRLTPRVRLMIAADVWRALLGGSLTVLGDHVVVVYVITFRAPRPGQSCSTCCQQRRARAGEWGRARSPPPTVASGPQRSWARSALAALAGLLYAALGTTRRSGINAASFLTSAALLVGLRLRTPARPISEECSPTPVAGLRVLASDRLLQAALGAETSARRPVGRCDSALLVVLARRASPAAAFGLWTAPRRDRREWSGPLATSRLVTDPRRAGFVFSPTCSAAWSISCSRRSPPSSRAGRPRALRTGHLHQRRL